MIVPNDGGPAFARCGVEISDGSWVEPQSGMTLREWFAGMALAGLCANPGGPIQANGMSGWGFTNCDALNVADVATGLADAMLAVRDGKESA